MKCVLFVHVTENQIWLGILFPNQIDLFAKAHNVFANLLPIHNSTGSSCHRQNGKQKFEKKQQQHATRLLPINITTGISFLLSYVIYTEYPPRNRNIMPFWKNYSWLTTKYCFDQMIECVKRPHFFSTIWYQQQPVKQLKCVPNRTFFYTRNNNNKQRKFI